jgi:predicted phosphodiesterase
MKVSLGRALPEALSDHHPTLLLVWKRGLHTPLLSATLMGFRLSFIFDAAFQFLKLAVGLRCAGRKVRIGSLCHDETGRRPLMRIAILSDIHGNYEALQAVLDDIDRSAVDQLVSLGDNVGYGPDPQGVLETLAGLGVPSVVGNHEMGLVDVSFLSWFNASARKSLAITRRLLSQEGMELIRAFDRRLILGSALFVHGCPPDSFTRYLFEVHESEWPLLFSRMDQRICFVGHTHELAMVELDETGVRERPLTCGSHRLEAEHRYVINAGSVGQPRDGDRRAKYVIWDEAEGVVDIRCLAYDVEKTVKKILALGFPQINARRLL